MPASPDQQVRGSTRDLPNGTCNPVRVAVFTSARTRSWPRPRGRHRRPRRTCRHMKAGQINLIGYRQSGCHSRVGRSSDPSSPRTDAEPAKVASVTPDVATAVRNATGQVTYRVYQSGIVHCNHRQADFEYSAEGNLAALIRRLRRPSRRHRKAISEARRSVSHRRWDRAWWWISSNAGGRAFADSACRIPPFDQSFVADPAPAQPAGFHRNRRGALLLIARKPAQM